MASKGKKNGSKSKPHKDDKDTVPEKQPKDAPKENKSEAKAQKEAALNEAKARIKILKSTAEEIRARIKAERPETIHDPSVIQVEIERARLNWEKVQSELDQAKGLSQKRKNEIDEWKAWYEKLPTAEKQSGLERLQREIAWRANELASNGEKINELIPKEFEAKGVFEMAKLKLAAFQAGVHKLPMEEDPRLKSVLTELDKGFAAVAGLGPKPTERK